MKLREGSESLLKASDSINVSTLLTKPSTQEKSMAKAKLAILGVD
ncbi:hypothetical protein KUL42_32700 [Alteromonas sp. KUL42]|nr:hypothetical protein KUL42_32700 [Alteromonas sp. KUL42]